MTLYSYGRRTLRWGLASWRGVTSWRGRMLMIMMMMMACRNLGSCIGSGYMVFISYIYEYVNHCIIFPVSEDLFFGMRIYEWYGDFWFHLVSYFGKHAEACRALLFYRSPLLVSFYSLGTFGDSLFPLCENCGRIRLVSQLTYINLTILSNKRGCAPVTKLII